MKNLNNIQKSFIVVIVTTIAFAFIYYVPFEPFYEFQIRRVALYDAVPTTPTGYTYYEAVPINPISTKYVYIKFQKVLTTIVLILIASLTSLFIFKSKK